MIQMHNCWVLPLTTKWKQDSTNTTKKPVLNNRCSWFPTAVSQHFSNSISKYNDWFYSCIKQPLPLKRVFHSNDFETTELTFSSTILTCYLNTLILLHFPDYEYLKKVEPVSIILISKLYNKNMDSSTLP